MYINLHSTISIYNTQPLSMSQPTLDEVSKNFSRLARVKLGFCGLTKHRGSESFLSPERMMVTSEPVPAFLRMPVHMATS